MKRFSLRDLNNLPRAKRNWVVELMIRAGKRPSIICGSPEAGKSTIAIQLSKAVARGEDFLGRKTTQGRVIYWQSEEDEFDAAEDFLLGVNLDDPIEILHPDARDNNLTELAKALRKYPDTRLCIIETLMDFFKSEDIDAGPENRNKFAKLQELMGLFPQCAFVLLHWFKKSDSQKTGLSIHKMLGSTVIAAETSTKIFLREVSDSDHRRVIQVRIRKGKSIDETYLNWDDATKTSTLGMTVAQEKAERKVVVGEQSITARRTKLLAAVAANEGKATDVICAEAGGSKTDNLVELAYLEDDGKIYSRKRQGPKKNAVHWFVARGTPEELFLKFEDSTYNPSSMTAFYYGLNDDDKRRVWYQYPQHQDALKEKEKVQ
jgi:hypothetical protein